MFKCPCCGNRHRINEFDTDYECPNSNSGSKTFSDLVPTDQLSRSGYNMNRSSVLENAKRPVTIVNIVPTYRDNGIEIDKEVPKNY
jgi:hypothetical protein